MASKVKVIDIETSNLWTTEQVLARSWEWVDQTWWAGADALVSVIQIT